LSYINFKDKGETMENDSTDELMQLIEESWYWSTINDIVDMFDKYGMDNVLADVGNMKIQRDEAKINKLEEDL
jgi:Golgi nucleoside diphosphatase